LSPLVTAFLLTAAIPPRHTSAVKTSGSIVIDGHLDDVAWRDAAPIDSFTQVRPFDGRPPTERTRFRVLYDDQALYVGFECDHTRAPIIERLTRRDEDSESEWVAVQIDARLEGKVAQSFGVNVSGVLADAIITDPATWNFDWDENWEARTSRTATGWTAEYRIPFRVLRFDGRVPVQNWGFQVFRYIAQHQEADYWSYAPREVANPVAYFGRLNNLSGLKVPGALELRPFVRADGRRLDATSDLSARGYEAHGSLGLDLKWHLAPDLVLDGAIRPDFGHVEADQVILNLTNYETFLPEKRPLFLEGTEVFSFPLQVFYSRRIGFAPSRPTLRADVAQQLVRAPVPADIEAAAKLVGRLGSNWTIGMVSAVTGRNDVLVRQTATGATSSLLIAPLNAYNVLRVRREWGMSGHVGVIATGSTAFEANGGYAVFDDPSTGARSQLCPSGATIAAGARCFRDSYVAGADGLWRSPSGNYVVNGAVVGSLVHGGAPAIQLDGSTIGSGARGTGGWARIAKEGGKHVLASLTYSGASRALDYNDVGFMPRQNLHEMAASITYRTLEPGGVTLDTSTTLLAIQRRSLTGLDLGQSYELGSQLRFKNYWTLAAAAIGGPPRFDDRELGNGAAFQRGEYLGARLELGTDPKHRVVATITGQAQAIAGDARAYTAQGLLSLSPFPELNISLIPQVTWSAGEPRYAGRTMASATDPGTSDFVFGKLAAVSVGATLRASYTFTPRVSLQTYAQAFLAAGRFDDLRALPAVSGQRIGLGDVANAPAPTLSPTPSPDFEEAALNLNVVFRWEYRLGSTAFLVYSRSQAPSLGNLTQPAALQPWALGTRASADVILFKLSYWWAS
jgi:hypothetical protein